MCIVCLLGSDISSSLSSSASATICPQVKSLSTFSTGSNNVLALSATQTVKQPFSVAADWNVTGGFKFGSLVSQPISTPAAAAAAVAVSGHSSLPSAAVTGTQLSSNVRPASTAHSAGSSAAAGTTSQQSSVFATTSVSSIKLAAGVACSDAAQANMISRASSAAAATVSHCVTFSDGSTTASCSSAVRALAVTATECGSRKSVELGASSFIVSSFAVSPSFIQPLSSTTCASLTTSPVFSLPVTTYASQPSSLFSFGQGAFVQNVSKPLGVPSTSSLQFKAQLCTGQ